MSDADLEERGGEAERVRHHRFREAQRAGMEYADAEEFADSGVDVERLRELVRKACPPELLPRILL